MASGDSTTKYIQRLVKRFLRYLQSLPPDEIATLAREHLGLESAPGESRRRGRPQRDDRSLLGRYRLLMRAHRDASGDPNKTEEFLRGASLDDDETRRLRGEFHRAFPGDDPARADVIPIRRLLEADLTRFARDKPYAFALGVLADVEGVSEETIRTRIARSILRDFDALNAERKMFMLADVTRSQLRQDPITPRLEAAAVYFERAIEGLGTHAAAAQLKTITKKLAEIRSPQAR